MIVTLALRLAGLVAAVVGIRPAILALLAGLALGALPAGFFGLRIGRAQGDAAGRASAAAIAEANALARDLAETRLDLAAAREAAAAASAAAARNARAATRADTRTHAYARLLARRGAAGACGLTRADLRVLRGNAWAIVTDGRRPHAAAGL